MASYGTQLISRIIKTGCVEAVESFGIEESDFGTAEEKMAYRTLRGYYHSSPTKNSVPGEHSFKTYLPNFELFEDPGMTVEALCYELRQQRIARETQALGKDLVEQISKGRGGKDLQKLLTTTQENITRLLGFGHSRTTDIRLTDLRKEIMQEYNKAKVGGLTGKVSLPWQSLQKATGGLQEDDFYVFYGRPKSMKSWVIAYLMSYHFLTGKKVLVYTKEMTPRNVAKRVIACTVELDYEKLRLGQLDTGQEHALLDFLEMDEQLSQSPESFILLSGKDAAESGGDTIAWLHSKVKLYKPDVVYIDGLYLMNDGSDRSNVQEWARVMRVSRQARQMQLDTCVPVIATMQANRQAAKHNGGELDEIAYSDAIGQDVTGAFRTIREKTTPTISLVAAGNREYKMHGLRIGGIPATDFREKGLLTEGEILTAVENDKKPEEKVEVTARKKAAKKKEDSEERSMNNLVASLTEN